MIKLSTSDIVTAFSSPTIGTKVVNTPDFLRVLKDAIIYHDTSQDRIPGQSLVHLPEAIPFVSGGVGKKQSNPSAYCLREHRGQVHAYLRREYAAPVTDCHAVVYTLEAYLSDPDVDECPGERERILRENPTHVLVAVLASSGPKTTLSPYRFVKNLAGGNHEALAWTAEEIRAKAREIAAYTDEWAVVADEYRPSSSDLFTTTDNDAHHEDRIFGPKTKKETCFVCEGMGCVASEDTYCQMSTYECYRCNGKGYIEVPS